MAPRDRSIASYLGTKPLTSKAAAAEGHDALLTDVLPVAVGDEFDLLLRQTATDSDHGVWLGVDGEIEIEGIRRSQHQILCKQAPNGVRLRIVAANPEVMWLYNVRVRSATASRPSDRMSQGDYFAMRKTEGPEGVTYECCTTNKLAFGELTITLKRPGQPHQKNRAGLIGNLFRRAPKHSSGDDLA